MLKLYTFNISHFAEKARWTLDYEGVPYEERVLLPGPHQLVTRRVARRTHVPVLEHDGRYVQGSSAIIDYVADHLGGTKLTAIDPTERARTLELETMLDQAFGRGVQQVLYSALLKDRRTVIDLWSSCDITLAALLAPVCRVTEHRVKWPAIPAELAKFEASLRGRPTWNHVLRMYRDHRKPRVAHLNGEVT